MTRYNNSRMGTVKKLSLTEREKRQLRENYSHLAFPDSVKADHDGFVANSAVWLYRHAPRRLIEEIVRWKADPRRPGALVIDNVGIDPFLPDTPTDGCRSPDKVTSFSETVLTGVSAVLGEPFAFHHERNGDLVQDLTPIRGKEEELTNEGAARLGWHTEHAGTGLLRDPVVNVISYLAFIGLRPDHEGRAKTQVADVRDALALLDADQIAMLRSPSFRLKPPKLVREKLPLEDQAIESVRLVTGPDEAPEIRASLYGGQTEAMTVEGQVALDALNKALDGVKCGFTTKPGRILIIDNRMVLHARAPFSPRYDGKDRWLQRLCVTDSLWPLREWQRDAKRILRP